MSRADDVLPCRPSARTAAITCIGLALLSGLLAYVAGQTKSATIDEPLHLGAAVAHTWLGDFRVNPEDPPLWKYWAMLPHARSELAVDASGPLWEGIVADTDRSAVWGARLLFQTPGNNEGDKFLARSRAMMSLLGVASCLVTAWWAWKLCAADPRSGPAAALAAVAATVMLAIDPTFLAHAPLIKSDVAATLMLLAISAAVWCVGRRMTVLNLAALAGLCGVSLAVKFSAPLFVISAWLALAIRALLSHPWSVLGRSLEGRTARLAAAALASLIVVPVSWLVIWASYEFRYAPTPDPTVRLNITPVTSKIATAEVFLATGRAPTPADVAAWRPGLALRAIQWVDDRRFLPHAWLFGLCYVRAHSILRPAYLLGHLNGRGSWYYFPLAWVFKEPLASIVVTLAAAALVATPAARRRLSQAGGDFDPWAIVCVAVPILLYGSSAMAGDLNLGIRHLLPIYPLISIAVGAVFARAALAWPRTAWTVACVAALSLAVEVLVAMPNYLAFFNVACGGSRGGYKLLGDSNLDWGQDLPLLADWQRRHPTETLYFSYFGSVDPVFYNVHAEMMPGGLQRPGQHPSLPGPESRAVMAVSASNLQGMYLPAQFRSIYDRIKTWPPREVLGGTIYLYDFPQAPGSR